MFPDNSVTDSPTPNFKRKRRSGLVYFWLTKLGKISTKFSWSIFLLLVTGLSLILYTYSYAQQENDQRMSMFVPMGGGYKDLYVEFSQAAVANQINEGVNILVLPIAYASNPENITNPERKQLLGSAEKRRVEIDHACQQAAPHGISCVTKLLPILTHSDALDSNNLKDFTSDLSAIFILDGDPRVAMKVIGNSPLEQALEQASRNGAIIAGTGGGAVLQSKAMIAGYGLNFCAGNAVKSGASLIWNDADQHGLSFGIPNAVIEQRIFQQGNVGRLLTTIAQQGIPSLGIGIDAYTGLFLQGGNQITKVFGLYEIAIFDAMTYHAVEDGSGHGEHGVLNLRNVVIHLLAPGVNGYNLVTRTNSLAAPVERIDRDFNDLSLPKGAGFLFLSGDIPKPTGDPPIINSFISLTGGSKTRTLILVIRHESNLNLKNVADFYRQKFDKPALVIDYTEASKSIQPPHPKDYDAIIFMAEDQALLAQTIEQLAFIRGAWLSGKPLLAIDAAAAALGPFFSTESPTPQDSTQRELATQASFLEGQTRISPGLNLLNVMIEPQLMSDNRWGRLFSLAFSHPENLVIGLTGNTTLVINQEAAKPSGDQAIFVLDLRGANLGLGENQGFEIANGLLDIFADGEIIRAKNAEINIIQQTTLPTVSVDFLATSTPPSTNPSSVKNENTGLDELAVPTQPNLTPLSTGTYPYYPFTQTTTSPNLPIILGAVIIVSIVVLGWAIVSRRYRY